MKTRITNLAAVVALVGAATIVVGAQEPPVPEQLGRCFTPVTTTGVYFEVTADGPTERLLRLAPRAPQQHAAHSQVHVTAITGMRGSTADHLRIHPAPIHSVRLRGQAAAPTLLTPHRMGKTAPAQAHRHESVFGGRPTGVQGESLDVGVDSASGSSGCPLRLRHVVR